MKNMWRFVKDLDAIRKELCVAYTLDYIPEDLIQRTTELVKQCDELTKKALHRDWSAANQIVKFIEQYGY